MFQPKPNGPVTYEYRGIRPKSRRRVEISAESRPQRPKNGRESTGSPPATLAPTRHKQGENQAIGQCDAKRPPRIFRASVSSRQNDRLTKKKKKKIEKLKTQTANRNSMAPSKVPDRDGLKDSASGAVSCGSTYTSDAAKRTQSAPGPETATSSTTPIGARLVILRTHKSKRADRTHRSARRLFETSHRWLAFAIGVG